MKDKTDNYGDDNSDGNKTMVFTVSLPKGLLEKTDKKAKSVYLNRSEYIRQLILLDLGLLTVANKEQKQDDVETSCALALARHYNEKD
ncbi:MAG: hypothetical protein J6P03_03650 [Opitutales bacterium]|nr:hypothetical protein [Opitutales bacterium]